MRPVTAPTFDDQNRGMTTSHTDISTYVPRASYPNVRIGNLERHQACEELSTQFAAGRLSNEELDERLAAAVEARTAADLHWVVADLPPLSQESFRVASSNTPPANQETPPRSAGWRMWDVIVLLVLLGCLCVAGLAFLALLFAGVGTGAFMLAGTLSAIVAGTGGAAAVHLSHRSYDRQRGVAGGRNWKLTPKDCRCRLS